MTANSSSLARGLDAILKLNVNTQKDNALPHHTNHYKELPIELLIPGKHQPRKLFSEKELKELAESIKTQGIIQPIIVRESKNNLYEIIAGERRWRAAKLISLKIAPVIIKEVNDAVAAAFSLVENIQRQNLNPMEEAVALNNLHQEFSLTHDEIAKHIGKSRSSVTNLLRLLNLTENVQQLIMAGKIEFGHARVLLSLEEKQQLVAANIIIEKSLSVREAEKLVKKIKKPTKQTQSIAPDYMSKIEKWNKDLTKLFSSTVAVKLNSKGEGSVVIHVKSPEEVDWLVEHLKLE